MPIAIARQVFISCSAFAALDYGRDATVFLTGKYNWFVSGPTKLVLRSSGEADIGRSSDQKQCRIKALLIVSIVVFVAFFCSSTTYAQDVSRDRPPLFDRAIWLGPAGFPPPIPSEVDFMAMFTPDARWESAAAHTKVFILYGDFVGHASQDQVTKIVVDLKSRHIAIAVQVGVMNVPHDPPSGCGGLGNVEGYGTVALAEKISRKIKEAGGEIKYIDMDEPFYYGHYFTSAPDKGKGCQSSVSEIIDLSLPTLAEFVKEFPEIIIGDTEPTLIADTPKWKSDLLEWTEMLSKTIGRPLAFLQLDVGWPLPDGTHANGIDKAVALYDYADELIQQNLLKQIGIIYNGASSDTTDATWCEDARRHVATMEEQYNLHPQQVVFQSWNPNPTHSMPDTSTDTLAGLVNYFTSLHLPLR